MSKVKLFIKNLLNPIVNDLHIQLNPKKYRVGSYYCPVCKNKLRYFNPLPDRTFDFVYQYQFIHPITCMETINPFGYSCPSCGVTDRDRLYALYLKEYLSVSTKPIHFLDIAPREALTKFILSFKNVIYRSADLYNPEVDDQVDITDMKLYEDNRFDFLICSHVLEHVTEDIKAMRELHRVLKPGGKAIMMVPILLTLSQDYEDSSYTSFEDRWKHFGQGDHVRMYSKNGFTEKLSQVGFKVDQFDKNHFGADVFAKCGITERSVLYIVTKDEL